MKFFGRVGVAKRLSDFGGDMDSFVHHFPFSGSGLRSG